MKYIIKMEDFNLSMNSIKLFEGLVKDKNTPLKKYLVWSSLWKEDKDYSILVLVEIEPDLSGNNYPTKFWITQEYEAINGRLHHLKSQNRQYFLEKDIENIPFTSNSIEECIEFIKISLDAKKYNL